MRLSREQKKFTIRWKTKAVPVPRILFIPNGLTEISQTFLWSIGKLDEGNWCLCAKGILLSFINKLVLLPIKDSAFCTFVFKRSFVYEYFYGILTCERNLLTLLEGWWGREFPWRFFRILNRSDIFNWNIIGFRRSSKLSLLQWNLTVIFNEPMILLRFHETM